MQHESGMNWVNRNIRAVIFREVLHVSTLALAELLGMKGTGLK